jgi:hypothetical protein
MAFLRFTRDKRGYEHFQLLEPAANQRGAARPRILYWFRSPPNVKVGREPFDEAARNALERQNPGLEFNWPQILATPVPSAEADHWRRRRQQERAARELAVEDESPQAVEDLETRELAGVDRRAGNGEPAPDSLPPAEKPATQPVDVSRRKRRRRRGRRDRPDAASTASSAQEPDAGSTGPEIESDPDPEND